MKEPYLEVTYRRGRAMAAYLYLPRATKDKSHRTSLVNPGMIIDYTEDGKPIGIEITAPSKVSVNDLNRVLTSLGASVLTSDDVAPLKQHSFERYAF
jgi:uncharacterized protein YuzE